jgi:CRP-like cAMP-binding protein
MLEEFLYENRRFKADRIFECLGAADLEMLTRSSVTHRYKKGEILFREGGIPTGIYHVKSGLIKKYKQTSRGGEQIFYVCSTGELFGYHAVLSDEYYPDSAATIDHAEISFIPKDAFLTVIHRSNAFSNSLLKALSHEFSMYLNYINNLGTRTVRERLAFDLLLLEDKFNLHDGNVTEIFMSRTDLANMVGTAKETLVRVLLDFTNAGLIAKTDRSITILDRVGIIREANLRGFNRET